MFTDNQNGLPSSLKRLVQRRWEAVLQRRHPRRRSLPANIPDGRKERNGSTSNSHTHVQTPYPISSAAHSMEQLHRSSSARGHAPPQGRARHTGLRVTADCVAAGLRSYATGIASR
ncbi:hypothetical protein HPB50_000520 [Hyalomma asiaticum]|uniref:Uncharacterized protein n=1 Tax=Hyalomma asiaticum TaxID=266040 RepID=A0ACB7T2Y3_HYAAI|nr:hypothetical protein HPB50_000520 [Hyalomma asiaticum]